MPPSESVLKLEYSKSKFYSKARNIPRNVKIKRAGIIPYCIYNDEIHFALGVDGQYGELTDFGGGLERGENFIKTASRELLEESCGIFNFTKSDYKILNSPAIVNGVICIIFIKIGVTVRNYGVPLKLNDRVTSSIINSLDALKRDPLISEDEMKEASHFFENSGAIWISHQDILKLVSTPTKRVSKRVCHKSRIPLQNPVTLAHVNISLQEWYKQEASLVEINRLPKFYEVVRRCIYNFVTDEKLSSVLI